MPSPGPSREIPKLGITSPAPVFLGVNDVGASGFLSSSNASADFLLSFLWRHLVSLLALVLPPPHPPTPPWINGTANAATPPTGCAAFSLSSPFISFFPLFLTPSLPHPQSSQSNPRLDPIAAQKHSGGIPSCPGAV